MAKKVTTYEIKGMLSYYRQVKEEIPADAKPRILYCILKESGLQLREDDNRTTKVIKTEGATVTLPQRSLQEGLYGVCLRCAGETGKHHFLWKSTDQRDQKYAVLLRAAAAGNWPRSKIYDPIKEAALLDAGSQSFYDVPPAQKKLLLLQKLQLCSIRFDWNDEHSFAAEKEVKTRTLRELISVSHHMTELNDCRSFKDMLRMIGHNLFRALPSVTGQVAPDPDDEEVRDPAWPHLELVYEILHKIYNSMNINDVVRKKSTNVAFLSQTIALFKSRDFRERECLKQTIHRIYGRLTNRRATIRKIFNHVFATEIYEPMPAYRGISEILDILASIINGFARPIKEEHKKMLHRYLIPLHKLPGGHNFYLNQLHYCMVLFAGKDHTFTTDIIHGILRYWPVGSNPKEQLFLQELEDLFEYVEESDFEKVHDEFLDRFVNLLEAPHFQTTERALWFWRNPSFIELAVKHAKFGASLLRALFEPLQRNTKEHWHDSVKSMSQEILQLYQFELPRVYEECCERYDAAHATDMVSSAESVNAGGGNAGDLTVESLEDVPH